MIRQTSIDSYNLIRDLTGKRKEVYEFLNIHGPMTRRELREAMNRPNNEVTPRVKELIDEFRIRERGFRYDEKTKRMVHLLEAVKW